MGRWVLLALLVLSSSASACTLPRHPHVERRTKSAWVAWRYVTDDEGLTEQRWFGCVRGHGRVEIARVDERSPIRKVILRGRFVALLRRSFGHDVGTADYLARYNLVHRDWPRLATYLSDVPLFRLDAGITDVGMDRIGDVAWIEWSAQSSRVQLADVRGTRSADEAAGVRLHGLRVRGRAVSWLHGGELRRARFVRGEAFARRLVGTTLDGPLLAGRGDPRWLSAGRLSGLAAFRVSENQVRLVSTRTATYVDRGGEGCRPVDVHDRELLAWCGVYDLRLLRPEWEGAAELQNLDFAASKYFTPLALGRRWIMGRSCGDPDISRRCRYEFVRRGDGELRYRRTPRDLDGVELRPPRLPFPRIEPGAGGDRFGVLVIPRRRVTVACVGQCQDPQAAGDWVSWRDDEGIAVMRLSRQTVRRFAPPAGSTWIAVARRRGRRLLAVSDGSPLVASQVWVLRF